MMPYSCNDDICLNGDDWLSSSEAKDQWMFAEGVEDSTTEEPIR